MKSCNTPSPIGAPLSMSTVTRVLSTSAGGQRSSLTKFVSSCEMGVGHPEPPFKAAKPGQAQTQLNRSRCGFTSLSFTDGSSNDSRSILDLNSIDDLSDNFLAGSLMPSSTAPFSKNPTAHGDEISFLEQELDWDSIVPPLNSHYADCNGDGIDARYLTRTLQQHPHSLGSAGTPGQDSTLDTLLSDVVSPTTMQTPLSTRALSPQQMVKAWMLNSWIPEEKDVDDIDDDEFFAPADSFCERISMEGKRLIALNGVSPGSRSAAEEILCRQMHIESPFSAQASSADLSYATFLRLGSGPVGHLDTLGDSRPSFGDDQDETLRMTEDENKENAWPLQLSDLSTPLPTVSHPLPPRNSQPSFAARQLASPLSAIEELGESLVSEMTRTVPSCTTALACSEALKFNATLLGDSTLFHTNNSQLHFSLGGLNEVLDSLKQLPFESDADFVQRMSRMWTLRSKKMATNSICKAVPLEDAVRNSASTMQGVSSVGSSLFEQRSTSPTTLHAAQHAQLSDSRDKLHSSDDVEIRCLLDARASDHMRFDDASRSAADDQPPLPAPRSTIRSLPLPSENTSSILGEPSAHQHLHSDSLVDFELSDMLFRSTPLHPVKNKQDLGTGPDSSFLLCPAQVVWSEAVCVGEATINVLDVATADSVAGKSVDRIRLVLLNVTLESVELASQVWPFSLPSTEVLIPAKVPITFCAARPGRYCAQLALYGNVAGHSGTTVFLHAEAAMPRVLMEVADLSTMNCTQLVRLRNVGRCSVPLHIALYGLTRGAVFSIEEVKSTTTMSASSQPPQSNAVIAQLKLRLLSGAHVQFNVFCNSSSESNQPVEAMLEAYLDNMRGGGALLCAMEVRLQSPVLKLRAPDTAFAAVAAPAQAAAPFADPAPVAAPVPSAAPAPAAASASSAPVAAPTVVKRGLVATKNHLVFPSVAIGGVARQSLAIKNVGVEPLRLRLQLTLGQEVFSVSTEEDCETKPMKDILLPPGAPLRLWLSYTARTRSWDYGELRIEGGGQRYTLALCGYGACAELLLSSCNAIRLRPGEYWAGSVTKVNQTPLTLTNRGTRAAIVWVKSLQKGLHVEPVRFVLGREQSRSLHFSWDRDIAAGVDASEAAPATVRFLYCDVLIWRVMHRAKDPGCCFSQLECVLPATEHLDLAQNAISDEEALPVAEKLPRDMDWASIAKAAQRQLKVYLLLDCQSSSICDTETLPELLSSFGVVYSEEKMLPVQRDLFRESFLSTCPHYANSFPENENASTSPAQLALSSTVYEPDKVCQSKRESVEEWLATHRPSESKHRGSSDIVELSQTLASTVQSTSQLSSQRTASVESSQLAIAPKAEGTSFVKSSGALAGAGAVIKKSSIPLSVKPDCLAFSVTAPCQELLRSVRIQNNSQEQIELRINGPESGAFHLGRRFARRLVLKARHRADLPVRFSPSEPGYVHDLLVLLVEGGVQSPILVRLEGFCEDLHHQTAVGEKEKRKLCG